MIQLCFLTPYIDATARYVGTAAGNQEGVKKTGRDRGGRWGRGKQERGEMRVRKEKPQAEMEQGTPRRDSNISLLLKITLHKTSHSFKAQRVTEKRLSYFGLQNV